MIVDTLGQCDRYAALSPRFAVAFEFLKKLPEDFRPGRHAVDGDNCFALVQSYTTKPMTQAKFEAHRKYIDIQFIEAGRESILWSPLDNLTDTLQPYAAETDIGFYSVPSQWTPIQLHAGQFTILFPEDGHAPCIELNGATEVRKIVLKVRV